MGYIAQNEDTKKLYYSKGANKIAKLVGINPTTVTRNAKTTFTDKVYNGYRIAKTEEISNESRGKPYLRR